MQIFCKFCTTEAVHEEKPILRNDTFLAFVSSLYHRLIYRLSSAKKQQRYSEARILRIGINALQASWFPLHNRQ